MEWSRRHFRLAANLVNVFALFITSTSAILAATTPAPPFPAPPLQRGGRGGSGTALPDLFTGAMSTSIPIEVPPGRKGMDPGLSLDYRSNNGNGWLGVGWELELGAIERASQFGVSYTGDNYIFRIGGATIDLVNVGSNEYRAKIESGFSRVRKMNAADSRPYWEVTDTTGTRYLFGQSPASRQDNPADTNQIFRWCLDRVEDPHGNFMTTTYTKDQGQFYPKQIDYAGNGSLQPTNSVKFILESRTDTSTLYPAGFAVRTAYRLKTIDVVINGVRQRAYRLDYSMSQTTGRSLLVSMQQYGRDAVVDGNGAIATGSALPRVSLAYSGSSAGFPTYVAGPAFNDSGNWNRPEYYSTIQFPDINGDGRADSCGRGVAGILCALSNGSSFGTTQLWNSAFSDSNGWAASQSYWETLQFPDIDGDGKADVCGRGTAGILCALSNGSSFGTTQLWNSAFSDSNGWAASQSYYSTIRFSDINGDGKADVCGRGTAGIQCWLSNGAGFPTSVGGPGFSDSAGWNQAPYYSTIRFSDINGDGKADVCGRGTAGIQCWLSNGSGFPTQVAGPAFNDSGNWNRPEYYSTIQFSDSSGDGKPDVCARSSSGIVCFKNVEDGFETLRFFSNGLGLTTTIGYTTSTQYSNLQLPFSIQTVNSVSINDGNGHVATTLYTYAGGYYHIGDHDFRGFQKVNVFGPIGPNGEQTITETWFHQGNDTAVDVNNPNVSVGYMKGKPYRIRVTDGTGTKLSETTTSYAADDTAPYFNPPVQVNSTFEGKSTRVVYSYDSTYGNVTREDQYGDVGDPTDDRTVTRSFSPNTTAWIIGLLTNETIYQGIGTTTKVAATDSFYDGATSCQQASTNRTPTRGNVTRLVRWLSDGTSPETRMAYDQYGNPICTRDANGNTSTVVYDTSAMFPLVTTNPLGHRTTMQYYGVNGVPADNGLYGQPKSVTDPNGATTTTQYDVFGRTTLVTAPDNSWTRSSYNGFGAGVGTQYVRTTTSAGLSTWTYFDGLGRTITEKATGPDGKTIVTQTQYDSRGAVARSSLPYFEGGSPSWRSMTYDPLGRVINATDPDGSRALRCYRDWVTTSIDANNRRRRETRDAAGRVVQVNEYLENFTSCTTDVGTPYATTRYDYDVLGNLLTVTDAKGNVTEMRHDTLGRKRFMHDPDMGNWNYDYDVAGNLVRQTDARGQVVTFAYDALNRLNNKTLPGGKQIVYRYDDSVKKAVGRLFQVEDLSGSTTLTYNIMGRVVQTQKVVAPPTPSGSPATYVTRTTHDSLGRVKSIGYPDNTIVNYAYNGPLLERVYGQGNVYAVYSGYNALGQPARLTLGNGVITDYSYSHAANPDCPKQNFRPCTTMTQGAEGTYQDFQYRYDRGGNILSIDDVINGDQDFQYDALNRLRSATGPYNTIRYVYDTIGNVLCNSQTQSMFRRGPELWVSSEWTDQHPASCGNASRHGYVYLRCEWQHAQWRRADLYL